MAEVWQITQGESREVKHVRQNMQDKTRKVKYTRLNMQGQTRKVKHARWNWSFGITWCKIYAWKNIFFTIHNIMICETLHLIPMHKFIISQEGTCLADSVYEGKVKRCRAVWSIYSEYQSFFGYVAWGAAGFDQNIVRLQAIFKTQF